MSSDDRRSKEEELEQLKARVAQLEAELKSDQVSQEIWQAKGYYTAYYATTGFMLGVFGALTSLMFNVVGSLLFDKHPLQIIRVYLTFPLGASALELEQRSITLAIGCCLYIATGMLFGIPFHMLLVRFTAESSVWERMRVAAAMGIALWIINYYLILSWLQPLLFGGNWIVAEVPWYVGMLTHLVYGCTMALVYPLGLYSPYKPQTQPTQH